MKTRSTALLGASLLMLVASACQDQPTTAPSLRASAGAPASLEAGGGADVAERLGLTLPGDAEVFDLAPDLCESAINPGDYVCKIESPLFDFVNAKIVESLTIERTRFLTAYNLAADVLPMWEALLFQTPATEQSFGVNGEYTHVVGKAERDLKRFWDIESAKIQVVAMHGSMLLDTLRVAATYRALGIPAAAAPVYARMLRNTIVGSQTMVDGNHPFFTFNAVAATFGGGLPPKIVVGDGLLQGYVAAGFPDVGPVTAFAHEFGHQVQYAKGFGIAGTAPERTRFMELSADFLAAYYLTHARGAAMNRKRVEQFLDVSFQSGDCGFTSSGHHGTPNQRRAAAAAGFDLADQAQKQGHIMTPDQAHAAFLAVYPTLIAPDAP